MPHPNTRLTIHGGRLLVSRVMAGRPVAHVADEMGISRATTHKGVRRWRTEGDAGLHDGSSRPLAMPQRPHRRRGAHPRAAARTQARPRTHRTDPGRACLDSHRVLTRHQLNRPRWTDRPAGQVVRRYERERPGELVHADVKKLGNIPDGGGHRIMDRRQAAGNRQATTAVRKGGSPVIGYRYVHTAIDDCSRLACGEVPYDERGETAASFWERANTFSCRARHHCGTSPHGQRSCCRSRLSARTLGAAGMGVRFSRFGGPEVLEIVELPDPRPGPGEVRIAVRAAGVNASDRKKRAGLMDEELPQTMGYEAAGVVDRLGEGVADVAAI